MDVKQTSWDLGKLVCRSRWTFFWWRGERGGGNLHSYKSLIDHYLELASCYGDAGYSTSFQGQYRLITLVHFNINNICFDHALVIWPGQHSALEGGGSRAGDDHFNGNIWPRIGILYFLKVSKYSAGLDQVGILIRWIDIHPKHSPLNPGYKY